VAQHDYVIENQSGLNFRSDLNDALEAIVTNNSGATEPADPKTYQWWIDDSGASPILKIRDETNTSWLTIGPIDVDNFGLQAPYSGSSAPSSPVAFQFWADTSGTVPNYGTDKVLKIRNSTNSAWVILGSIDLENFGLLLKTGGTVTGPVIFNSTGYITVPVGTTGQRPTPATGQLRFNSTLVQFEGYDGTNWAPIGGGGYTVTTVQTVSSGSTVTISTTVTRQLRHVQGNAAPTTASTTPFGTSPPPDGTEITLVGNSDSASLIIPFNNATHGCVGNFSALELGIYRTATFVYSSVLARYILTQSGGF
jgi:hypothetical protein